ncbi:MAG: energy-coupling factor transporter transmembrane protein EcfT [Clostridium sp.]|nr:energy-coupling factor transporter transmembrane protein EcfT [Clostridium sp.]MCM1399479.1 energy-coupling factor transporter transmembrane protein EcfT [Clostridium sp.]MCM1460033.1 energy-coupling factor transporter transmembrane protein EcfT [Bacteroides sp.]
MSNIDKAIHEMCSMEKEAGRDGGLNSLHPLCKLFVTVWYVAFTISVQSNDVRGLIFMMIYPLAVFIIWDISFISCIKRIKVILAAIILLGTGNLFFAKPLMAGLILMLCLFMKGVLSVFAVYILAVTTRIEDICNALRIIRVPEILVTVILLIYRYTNILLKETKRMTEAYDMLAPNQKGIQFRVWGQFAGQLLLRSMDKAHIVYDSMNVRGYGWNVKNKGYKSNYTVQAGDVLWIFGWCIAIAVLRFVPDFVY